MLDVRRGNREPLYTLPKGLGIMTTKLTHEAPERIWTVGGTRGHFFTEKGNFAQVEYVRADSSPVDAETLVKQWISTLQNESHVTDEDAEDLMFRVLAALTSMRSLCVETIRALRPDAAGAGAFKKAAIKELESLQLQEQEK